MGEFSICECRKEDLKSGVELRRRCYKFFLLFDLGLVLF